MRRGRRPIRLAAVGVAVFLSCTPGTAGPVPRPAPRPHSSAKGPKGTFQVKVQHRDEGNWALTLAGFLALAGAVAGADAAVRRLRRGPPNGRAAPMGVAVGAALGGGVGTGFHWVFG